MSCGQALARMSSSEAGSASASRRCVRAASPTPNPNVSSGTPCSWTTTSHSGRASFSSRAA
jgi:hypothetical protein